LAPAITVWQRAPEKENEVTKKLILPQREIVRPARAPLTYPRRKLFPTPHIFIPRQPDIFVPRQPELGALSIASFASGSTSTYKGFNTSSTYPSLTTSGPSIVVICLFSENDYTAGPGVYPTVSDVAVAGANSYSIASSGNSYTTGTGVVSLTLTTTPALTSGAQIMVDINSGTGNTTAIDGIWTAASVTGDVVTLTA
jgi:hypothetical protein